MERILRRLEHILKAHNHSSLRVGYVTPMSPYILPCALKSGRSEPDWKHCHNPGYNIDVLSALARMFHIPLTLVKSVDGHYGKCNVTCTGLIGMLMNDTIDVTASTLNYYKDRLENVWFAQTIASDEIGFTIPPHLITTINQIDPSYVQFSAFDGSAICFMVSLLSLLTLILSALNRQNLVWPVFAQATFRQALPPGLKGSIWQVALILSSFYLYLIYQSACQGRAIKNQQSMVPFKDIDGFQKHFLKGRLKVVVLDYSEFDSIFEDWPKIVEYQRRFPESVLVQKKGKQLAEMLCDPSMKLIYFGPIITEEYFLSNNEFCSLAAFRSKKIAPIYRSFATQRNSIFRDFLNYLLSGLFNQQNYLAHLRHGYNLHDEYVADRRGHEILPAHRLSLDAVHLPFWAYLTALSTAILFFCIEFIFYRSELLCDSFFGLIKVTN